MGNKNHFRTWGLILLSAVVLGYIAFEKLLPHGSTTLSWVAPTQTEAGEPLTDLAGYFVHCWGDSGRYTNTIRINDPATERFEVRGLSPGTYQCAVSAFNENGDESALSNVVARVIP